MFPGRERLHAFDAPDPVSSQHQVNRLHQSSGVIHPGSSQGGRRVPALNLPRLHSEEELAKGRRRGLPLSGLEWISLEDILPL